MKQIRSVIISDTVCTEQQSSKTVPTTILWLSFRASATLQLIFVLAPTIQSKELKKKVFRVVEPC